MNALFGWPGGKRNLVKTILPRIPKHTLYVEVFSGSAKLLFAKEPSRAEVINDVNGDLVNFHRVVKHRAAELAELLEHELVHPERFRDLRVGVETDELGRAARFVYLTWYSFGAKGEHFARPALKDMLKGGARRSIQTVREMLLMASDRLQQVRIEQRDFAEIIKRFDSPETFFYLDPPYVDFQSNGRYNAISAERRVEMFDLLSQSSGRFLLSFDDVPEVRQLAGTRGMDVSEVETSYSLSSKTSGRGRLVELLISEGKGMPATLHASAAIGDLAEQMLSTLAASR